MAMEGKSVVLLLNYPVTPSGEIKLLGRTGVSTGAISDEMYWILLLEKPR
jgi:hypothetical protein